jgi:hypothetical protein
VEERELRDGEIPMVGQDRMEAAHAIPFLLTANSFDDRAIRGSKIVLNLPSSSGLMHHCTQKDHTWDMLESWTRIDV